MIISASRRTDIPAFYAEWFINRLRDGYCTVPNPFNPAQVTRVSLRPTDVDVFVFWTRNPRPLFPYLNEMDERGYRYYFQYTLMGNPHQIDPRSPSVEAGIRTFRELAEQIGPQRVIWRYDPIVLTRVTPAEFHLETYRRITQALLGYTSRSVISVMDVYGKAKKRLAEMARQGAPLLAFDGTEMWFDNLMRGLVSIAHDSKVQITSCAEELDLGRYGVQPGKCIDDKYISQVFGLDVSRKKDPGQRKACGCVVSKDIGVYDSCMFECQYCYASGKFERARARYNKHDPDAPFML